MKIRNINQDDSKDLFKWRNNEESRKMFFQNKIINLKEHEKWFNDSIKNPHKEFLLGEYNGNKLGVCRFDYNNKENFSEVSININPNERGKGYGKKLLSKAIKIYLSNKQCILRARIKNDNFFSLKLFTYVGFIVIKEEEDIVYLEFKNKLIFKKVEIQDALILYDLLKERKHNISHKLLPDFKIHKKFVINNPYLYWYIFFINRIAIGTFYIKDDNSIGININNPTKSRIDEILGFILDNFSPCKSIPSEIPNYFFINISQSNNDLKKILNSLDYKPIQVSYKLTRS